MTNVATRPATCPASRRREARGARRGHGRKGRKAKIAASYISPFTGLSAVLRAEETAGAYLYFYTTLALRCCFLVPSISGVAIDVLPIIPMHAMPLHIRSSNQI